MKTFRLIYSNTALVFYVVNVSVDDVFKMTMVSINVLKNFKHMVAKYINTYVALNGASLLIFKRVICVGIMI